MPCGGVTPPMAKRSMKGYKKLQIADSLTIGVLTSGDVISEALPTVLTQDRRISSVELLWAARGFTPGEGPIDAGVAHSDYSAAEIEECLEATGSWSDTDKVAAEQANRLVRRIVTFANEVAEQVANDGKPIKTKLNWRIPDGSTLQVWARNRSGATIATGGVIALDGHANSFTV